MYELIQATESTFYMDCPSKVGFFRIGEDAVVLIDSGSDKDAAKKAKRILEDRGWSLKAIFNTHAHADHIGGNAYLQAQTDCRIYAPGVERSFTEYPFLEPVSLFGGHAPLGLQNKFLMAKPSRAEELTDSVLPRGLRRIDLPGHSYAMTGFQTDDGAVFLADCLAGEETIKKYRIGYLYDVAAYLDTLEKVKTLRGVCFIPSHAEKTADIAPLAQINIDTTKEIADTLKRLLVVPKTFDELLSAVFSEYGLAMNLSQYALIGSTVRAYLSYLEAGEKVRLSATENRMLWQSL